MNIGILSDIHDHVWNLDTVLPTLAACDVVICCGDLCSPFIIGLLGEGLAGKPVQIVFGNNDGDLFRITQNAARWPNITLAGEQFTGEIGGRKIHVNHYPSIAETVDERAYDLICYGHDHRFRVYQRGQALVVNPGAIMGYDSAAKRDIPATFVVYDTDLATVEAFQIVDVAKRTVAPYAFSIETGG